MLYMYNTDFKLMNMSRWVALQSNFEGWGEGTNTCKSREQISNIIKKILIICEIKVFIYT